MRQRNRLASRARYESTSSDDEDEPQSSRSGKTIESKQGFQNERTTRVKPDKRSRRFSCDQCGGSFSRKSGVDFHIKRVHKKIKPYTCNTCDKSLVHKWDLDLHAATHMSRDERQKLGCTRCSTFQNLDSTIACLQRIVVRKS